MGCMVLGNLFALILALVQALPTDAFGMWRGTTELENRIVFSGRHFEDYRAWHHHRSSEDSNHKHETYIAQWKAGSRRLPIFLVFLQRLAPDSYFSAGKVRSLEQYAKGLRWFKGKPFSDIENGTAGTVLGPASFLIFSAGKHRCGVFSVYVDDGAISRTDTLGNTHLKGFYCPVSAQVDAAALESLLAKVGIRDIAVPKAEEGQPGLVRGSRRPPMKVLTTMVTTGDIKQLRRVAVKDFDPDTAIAFQHPRFARSRVIQRPMLMAAALFGQTEMVVFLLKKGASTRGPAAGAICAAIARRHIEIVEVLLKKDPELKDYNRCGQSRNLSAIDLARRLNLAEFVDGLLETKAR